MTPRFTFSKSVFRTISTRVRDVRLARRPSGLTLGVAAATAVTAAGVAIAVSVTPAPTSSSFSPLGAVGRASHAATVSHSGRQPVPAKTASGGGRPSSPPRQPASGTQAASKAPATHHQAHAPAKRPAPPKHAAAGKPYLIYDSTTPTAIPAHHAVATYATGSYAASPGAVAGRRTVLWIDTTGSDPKASILDVEPGDATPSMAASWAHARLTRYPTGLARIYTMRSEWPAVQAAIATLPAHMRSHVRYWIADPTGVPHLVPGSQATQWYWGSSFDISTATPGF